MSDKLFLTPVETAEAVVASGKRVLTQSIAKTMVLSLLAGFYIGFGGELATVITSDADAFVGSGIARFLGGSVFSLGLMLVVICGAELFTGNSLLTKAALQREIPWSKIAGNWVVVLLGNFLGSLFFAWLMFESRLWEGGAVADKAIAIASAKTALPFSVALVRGILCNWLVCLAVFMATASRDIPGKILSCYMPIMAFVASGFEHSIANMYFIPTGIMLANAKGISIPGLDWPGFFGNLVPVTIGNVLGGVIFVAFAYWFTHLSSSKTNR